MINCLFATSVGLLHLHCLNPHLIHKNFKTTNKLIGENFNAKVFDAVVSKLLKQIEDAGPSHTTSVNVFRDPE